MRKTIIENVTRTYIIGSDDRLDRAKIYSNARDDLTKTIDELDEKPDISVLYARWYYQEERHCFDVRYNQDNSWTLIQSSLTMYEVTDVKPTAIKWMILIERTIGEE